MVSKDWTNSVLSNIQKETVQFGFEPQTTLHSYTVYVLLLFLFLNWVVLTSWDRFNDWLQVKKANNWSKPKGVKLIVVKRCVFLAFARLLVCFSSKFLNVFRIVLLRCKHENSFYKYDYLLSLLVPWLYKRSQVSD